MEEKYTEDNLKPSKLFKGIFDILESLSYAIIVVILLFTFLAKLTVVDGSSMENTLYHGQYLVVTDPFFTYSPSQGDIVVIQGDFVGDKYDHPIVKRVIATEGQESKIVYERSKMLVYVDGQLLEEEYAKYISSLKTVTEPPTRVIEPDKNGIPQNWERKNG